jgi:hypothetical protein
MKSDRMTGCNQSAGFCHGKTSSIGLSASKQTRRRRMTECLSALSKGV